ncbi:unnamed protein product [Protopolystoma xenopodis]|uniref:Uncharacterized protein n=1 Tax=Protopolystoma xenopodis TaxID=117903 RepID=A0A3S5AZS3_9PLAT|nr:unnamed protein product [Protopolystoma xenopodis]
MCFTYSSPLPSLHNVDATIRALPPDGFGLALPSTIGNSTGFPMAAPATGGIAYVYSNGSTLTTALHSPFLCVNLGFFADGSRFHFRLSCRNNNNNKNNSIIISTLSPVYSLHPRLHLPLQWFNRLWLAPVPGPHQHSLGRLCRPRRAPDAGALLTLAQLASAGLPFLLPSWQAYM